MSEQRGFASIGQKWSGWATIIGMMIALVSLFGLGRFLYNEVWLSKALTYTILPTYDLGHQAFTGLVIENRGKVPLTGVQIILSDLGAPINVLHMPGVHEPAQLVSGGVGQKEVLIEMPRLSTGASLSIYILTSDVVKLEEGETFLISSNETTGVTSTRGETPLLVIVGATVVTMLAGLGALVLGFIGFIQLWMQPRRLSSTESVVHPLSRDLPLLRRRLDLARRELNQLEGDAAGYTSLDNTPADLALRLGNRRALVTELEEQVATIKRTLDQHFVAEDMTGESESGETRP